MKTLFYLSSQGFYKKFKRLYKKKTRDETIVSECFLNTLRYIYECDVWECKRDQQRKKILSFLCYRPEFKYDKWAISWLTHTQNIKLLNYSSKHHQIDFEKTQTLKYACQYGLHKVVKFLLKYENSRISITGYHFNTCIMLNDGMMLKLLMRYYPKGPKRYEIPKQYLPPLTSKNFLKTNKKYLIY
jgi:hypothetical protein